MIPIEQIKKILFFEGLSDKNLSAIGDIAEIKTYEEEAELFKQNTNLSKFYMILSGKIFLNSRSPKGASITLDEVTPGHSFGLSAIMGDIETSFAATCAKQSTVITIHNDDMLKLFENNRELGYLIMQRVVQLFQSRTSNHTQQLLNSLASHPEIKKNL